MASKLRPFRPGAGRIAVCASVPLLVSIIAACGGGSYGSHGGGGGMGGGPVITQQPMNQTVTHPSPATFSVAASGGGGAYMNAALSYQWMMAGNPIMGATMSSYTISTTSVGMSGETFSVNVSDGGGTTTSMSATLMVN